MLKKHDTLENNHSIGNIVVKEKIGEGNFGEVYSGLWNLATPVALKKLKNEEYIREFVKEANILMYLLCFFSI